MSRLEDRLRDAYRDEAGAVTPESILGLGEAIAAQSPRSARSGRAPRWSRWLTPLAAAAAVAVIVVVAAVAVPRDAGQSQSSAGAAPKFLIASTGVSTLQVRNLTTGALVARVTVPQGYPGGNSHTYINAVATWNGRDYLVAEYANPCRSWIYQFSLDSAGHPSALTPFAALPTVPSDLYDLAVSADGQMVAFTTNACMGAKAQPNYVGVTNVRTGHTTRWTAPARSGAEAVSLTADGRQLSYGLVGTSSVVRVIPTSAAPGRAADLGRTVAQAGSGQFISFSTISADGRKVYFVTYPESARHGAKPAIGQVRMMDLTTGRSHVVSATAGRPGLFVSSPDTRYLLQQIWGEETAVRPLKPPRLARLDLATGKVMYLPSGWLRQFALLYW